MFIWWNHIYRYHFDFQATTISTLAFSHPGNLDQGFADTGRSLQYSRHSNRIHPHLNSLQQHRQGKRPFLLNESRHHARHRCSYHKDVTVFLMGIYLQLVMKVESLSIKQFQWKMSAPTVWVLTWYGWWRNYLRPHFASHDGEIWVGKRETSRNIYVMEFRISCSEPLIWFYLILCCYFMAINMLCSGLYCFFRHHSFTGPLAPSKMYTRSQPISGEETPSLGQTIRREGGTPF